MRTLIGLLAAVALAVPGQAGAAQWGLSAEVGVARFGGTSRDSSGATLGPYRPTTFGVRGAGAGGGGARAGGRRQGTGRGGGARGRREGLEGRRRRRGQPSSSPGGYSPVSILVRGAAGLRLTAPS